MPELPETETIARDLDAALRGAVIESMTTVQADVLRMAPPAVFARRVTGRAIVRSWRRAKLVVLDLDDGARIVVQPRFTGALLLDDAAAPDDPYVAVRWALSGERALAYRDVRRLGTVALMSATTWDAYSGALGPEPLDASFGPAVLATQMRRTSRPIKAALMDQRLLAGVGNIYATESLWDAGVDPSRGANALDDDAYARVATSLARILTASVAARGTTFRDYRDASGGRGTFAAALQAYGRAGEPCARCGRRLASTMAIDGRTTVFCAWCQR